MQTNKQSSASLGEGKITEKAMEEMRARIGKPMRHLAAVATKEHIDHCRHK